MIIRTTKVLTAANEEICSSTCTIDSKDDTMKNILIRQIGSLSSGTVAVLTGITKYTLIDVLTEKVIKLVDKMPEKAVETLSDGCGKFSLAVISGLFKTAMRAI